MSAKVTTKEVLTRARELISKGWTQENFARDAHNSAVAYSDPHAVCFCSEGAIFRAVYEMDPRAETVGEALRLLEYTPQVGGRIVAFNDRAGRTKEEVLEVFDLAIKDIN